MVLPYLPRPTADHIKNLYNKQFDLNSLGLPWIQQKMMGKHLNFSLLILTSVHFKHE